MLNMEKMNKITIPRIIFAILIGVPIIITIINLLRNKVIREILLLIILCIAFYIFVIIDWRKI